MQESALTGRCVWSARRVWLFTLRSKATIVAPLFESMGATATGKVQVAKGSGVEPFIHARDQSGLAGIGQAADDDHSRWARRGDQIGTSIIEAAGSRQRHQGFTLFRKR